MIDLNKYCDYSSKHNNHNSLQMCPVETPLGRMVAIANEEQLFLLEFDNRCALEKQIYKLKKQTNISIIPGVTEPIIQIRQELKSYFTGELKTFSTKLHLSGSPFQLKTWHALTNIPYGKTLSYLELAHIIGKPLAFRAAANANGANRFAIIIPCHRVINNNGQLGGYAGGIDRKRKLLEFEGVV